MRWWPRKPKPNLKPFNIAAVLLYAGVAIAFCFKPSDRGFACVSAVSATLYLVFSEKDVPPEDYQLCKYAWRALIIFPIAAFFLQELEKGANGLGLSSPAGMFFRGVTIAYACYWAFDWFSNLMNMMVEDVPVLAIASSCATIPLIGLVICWDPRWLYALTAILITYFILYIHGE